MKEIPIHEIENIRIGQTENAAAGTGCTVFVCPEGMRAGIDVRGGGPASREIHLLHPLTAAQSIMRSCWAEAVLSDWAPPAA